MNKRVYWLPASLAFTGCLLLVRIAYTGTLKFIFLGWNLFLACIPLIISWHIIRLPGATSKRVRYKQYAWLFTWLLFFPNAPYLVTDLFHFMERKPVPVYYDLVLLFMAAFNGLLLGFLSLQNIEQQWKRMHPTLSLPLFRLVVLFLCSFGIYLGRYGRFNSWDIINAPAHLFSSVAERIIYPFEHFHTWAMTFLFTMMLFLLYSSIKTSAMPTEDSPAG